jgi:hypothetical protein
MPYKVIGKNLWHKIKGRWTIKQHCRSHENALKAKRLLLAIEHNKNFKERR